MGTRLFPALFGAGIGLAVVASPAPAADDIEAKAQLCAACHGQNGVPADPNTVPIIWGQERSYLFKQMRDYRNGERDNPIMSPIARSLAEEDLRKIASYFAAKTWPALNAASTSAPTPKGITLCQPCHQPIRSVTSSAEDLLSELAVLSRWRSSRAAQNRNMRSPLAL
jgi:cytochrome c553